MAALRWLVSKRKEFPLNTVRRRTCNETGKDSDSPRFFQRLNCVRLNGTQSKRLFVVMAVKARHSIGGEGWPRATPYPRRRYRTLMRHGKLKPFGVGCCRFFGQKKAPKEGAKVGVFQRFLL